MCSNLVRLLRCNAYTAPRARDAMQTHGAQNRRRSRSDPHAHSIVQAQARGAHSTYRFVRRRERVKVGLKLAGVHWCVKSYGHAAELTAGYYNTAHRNGYKAIMKVRAWLALLCRDNFQKYADPGRALPEGVAREHVVCV